MYLKTLTPMRLAMLGSGLLLAGCSGFSSTPPMRGNPVLMPLNLPAVQSSAPKDGATFPAALADEYAKFATDLSQQKHDWADSDYFSRKGLAAAGGQVVLPEQNSNWLVPLEVPLKTRDELANGRRRLMAALDAGGRDRYPKVAARAQVRYDCWVEEMEKDWRTAMNGACHKEFLDALDELERDLHGVTAPAAATQAPPLPATRQYNVYFDFDKAVLTPEAQQIVKRVAGSATTDKSRVAIVGKADLSGTNKYNLALSHRRADAVRQALVAAGVPADHIDERWVGDREPPVPTAAGVREPRNRVVEVTFH